MDSQKTKTQTQEQQQKEVDEMEMLTFSSIEGYKGLVIPTFQQYFDWLDGKIKKISLKYDKHTGFNVKLYPFIEYSNGVQKVLPINDKIVINLDIGNLDLSIDVSYTKGKLVDVLYSLGDQIQKNINDYLNDNIDDLSVRFTSYNYNDYSINKYYLNVILELERFIENGIAIVFNDIKNFKDITFRNDISKRNQGFFVDFESIFDDNEIKNIKALIVYYKILAFINSEQAIYQCIDREKKIQYAIEDFIFSATADEMIKLP